MKEPGLWDMEGSNQGALPCAPAPPLGSSLSTGPMPGGEAICLEALPLPWPIGGEAMC